MKIGVTKKRVNILEGEQVNQFETGVNECEFTLPPEFDGLTVTAVFNGVPVPIGSNGTCVMPALERGDCTLGVYAYSQNGDGETVLMYSPVPAVFFVERGSFDGTSGRELSADISLYEQYCTLLQNRSESLMNELDEAENLRISAENLRISAESERVNAETQRASSEAARAAAETGRVSAETARAAAESVRAASEINRQAALVNALGIRQIVIENADNGESYVPRLKIENGKPRLYLDAAADEEE